MNSSLVTEPLFSILVPTYNQSQYLSEALDSILSQSFQNWEAVIVNDGSTDNTKEIMREYASKDSRFKCYHKENGGLGTALNEALRQTKGVWICWLSSDDLFLPRLTLLLGFQLHGLMLQ